jgi:hypothetical protein
LAKLKAGKPARGTKGKASQKANSKKKLKAGIRQMRTPAPGGDCQLTSKARLILTYAHDSAEALATAFAGVRKLRGAKAGTTTDEEQDLLRAMLVLAAAGLDSMAKQLIRDTLPKLIECDSAVRDGFETFVARQIRGDADVSPVGTGFKFLARVMVAESYRDQLIEEYVLYLTGTSLQSSDELYRTASALGIDPQAAGIERNALKPIFDVRNKIVHELDINFDHPTRNRQSRSRATMTKQTNTLLEVGENILDAVDATLAGAT